MSAPYEVLGIGECSVDEVGRVDAAPASGGKARLHARKRLPGGQVATAILACARLGHRCALVSSVGADAEGGFALAPLAAAGVDLARVRRVPGVATRSAWIWVDERTGERTVLWQRDDGLALAADAVAREDVAAARVVLLDASDLALALRVADLAREHAIPCVLDADAPAPGIDALLAAVSHPVISEPLAVAVYGSAGAAIRLLAREGARLPVVTRGRAGALAWIDGRAVRSPAFPIDAVDTTGAGDAFHAGVAHGILTGLDAEATLRVAHAVAACACLAEGAQGGLPDRATLSAFLSEHASEPVGWLAAAARWRR